MHLHDRRRPSLLAAFAAGVATLCAAAGPATAAHFKVNYYKEGVYKRQLDANGAFAFRFDSDFPGGKFRYRVNSGARQWVRADGRALFRGYLSRQEDIDSNKTPRSNLCPGPTRNGRNTGVVHWIRLDGTPTKNNSLGATRRCYYVDGQGKPIGELASFHMWFDSAEPWYNGTGNAPAARKDLWSVATHEFGHATGFGYGKRRQHFSRAMPFCDNVKSQETMCPNYFPGSERQRTIGWRDRHAFRTAYP